MLSDFEREQIEIAAKEFERLHSQGAENFGISWLTANIIMSRLAHLEYAPEGQWGETDMRIKAMLSQAAWEYAELLEQAAKLRAAISDILDVANACEAQGRSLVDFAGTVAYVGSRPMQDAIEKLQSAVADDKWHIHQRNTAQNELAREREKVEALRAGLNRVANEAYEARGQWGDVQPEYSPEWSHGYLYIEEAVKEILDEVK